MTKRDSKLLLLVTKKDSELVLLVSKRDSDLLVTVLLVTGRYVELVLTTGLMVPSIGLCFPKLLFTVLLVT